MLKDLVEGGATGLRPDRYCDVDKIFDSMDGTGGGRGLTVGKQGIISGLQAVEVVEKTSKATTRFWVAIDEPHYLLRLELKQGAQTADTTFSEFNNPQRSSSLQRARWLMRAR